MRRTDFHALTRTRLRDARTLLRANRAAGAYYLTGQAVECALKACIARKTERHEFPDRDRTSGSYTHDLTKLIKTAHLKPTFDAALQAQPALEVSWTLVKDWNFNCRYDHAITMAMAREFYRAVTRRNTGVMAWIRQQW